MIFCYIPMAGVVMAFQNYKPSLGFLGSEWVGFYQFTKFFGSYQCQRVIVNTLRITVYSLLVGFPLPIFFALFLNVINSTGLKKTIQTITYMPHFVSTVVVVGMLYAIMNPISGVYGTVYRMLGNTGYPNSITQNPSSFIHLYVWSGVWQELGWNSIIYVAALSSVDPQLHEAAMIDGASRWRRIWTVDLPAILPTITVIFIINSGYIMSVGFEKVYLMQSNLNLMNSEVIATYVYKAGLTSGGNYSYASAIGLFNSLVNCAVLLLVNFIVRKMNSEGASLF